MYMRTIRHRGHAKVEVTVAVSTGIQKENTSPTNLYAKAEVGEAHRSIAIAERIEAIPFH